MDAAVSSLLENHKMSGARPLVTMKLKIEASKPQLSWYCKPLQRVSPMVSRRPGNHPHRPRPCPHLRLRMAFASSALS